ncbi:MAG: RseA family anti-sigma factor [Burkholderiales bacterium]
MVLKVSQILDGQIDDALVKRVLDEIAADPALRDRYTIYGLIGDALRGNGTPDDGFTKRILDRLKREGVSIDPTYDPLA